MTFQESVKTCFSKYADFNGRASRSEFWWFMLFVTLASIASSFLGPLVAGLFFLGTLLPSVAVSSRRLHDTNRTGWWQLVGLIPIVGFIILIVFLAQESRPADGAPGATAQP